MKVVCFSAFPLEYGGGCERHLVDVFSALAAKHTDSSIMFLTFGNCFQRFLRSAMSIFHLKFVKKTDFVRESSEDIRRRIGYASYTKTDSLWEILHILKSADVIYTKNEVIEGLFLRLFFWLLPRQVPLVVGMHTPVHYPIATSIQARLHNFVYRSSFYHWLFSRSYAFRALNSTDHTVVSGLFPKSKVELIYRPSDLHKKAVSLKRDMADPYLRIAFIGRLTEQKGIDHVIPIVEEIARDTSLRVHWRIIGSGDKKFQDLCARAAHAYEGVEYLGHVQQEMVYEHYTWADVILLPSRYEGMPNVMIEGMALGKLVLASDIAGINDVITDGFNGFLLKDIFRDSVRLIKEIDCQKIDSCKYQEIRLHARETFNELFRSDINEEKIWNLLLSAAR